LAFLPILFWHLCLFHLHAWHPPPVLRNRVIVNFLRASGGKKALAGKTAFGKTALGKTALGKTALGKTALGKTGFCKTAFSMGKTAFSMGKTGFDESGLLFTTNMRFPFVFKYAIMLFCIHNKKNKNVKRINFFVVLFLLVQQFA